MPELKRPGRTRIPRIGDAVECMVVKPHDGIPAGETRRVRYSEVVRYMVEEGFWKIIG